MFGSRKEPDPFKFQYPQEKDLSSSPWSEGARGPAKPTGDRNNDHVGAMHELMSKNLISKEGEPFHLPVAIPVKVRGNIASVDFSGEGTLQITGFDSDEDAIKAGWMEWRLPGKDIPNYVTYVDNKVGKMFSFRLGDDLAGWWRAKMPGRLASTTGVNVVFWPRGPDSNAKKGGWTFFDAGKYNALLEFALNKVTGWVIWDAELLWNLLTADTLSLGWPKEMLKKINFREHFFSNIYNRMLLVGHARGRMGYDPARTTPVSGMDKVWAFDFGETLWVDRYVKFASAIERHVEFDHPENANLFPGWAADTMATHAVNLRAKMNFIENAKQYRTFVNVHKENKVEILDIAGNLVGIGECYWWDRPSFLLSPEYAADCLVEARRTSIDSPNWLRHDGGVEFVNNRNEFYELLLAGKVEEARKAWEDTYSAYSKYLTSKAKVVPARKSFIDEGIKLPDDWYDNFGQYCLDKVDVMLDWDLFLAYVRSCVERGQWKPVNVTPLRVSAPPEGAAIASTPR
ncbi:MAG: hypothetical protein HRF40_06985 [Nitrososphaera sp.]